jgi:hypothetical protein
MEKTMANARNMNNHVEPNRETHQQIHAPEFVARAHALRHQISNRLLGRLLLRAAVLFHADFAAHVGRFVPRAKRVNARTAERVAALGHQRRLFGVQQLNEIRDMLMRLMRDSGGRQ